MAGPLTWWANRKSRMGMMPSAREPTPHAPGKPWWTAPPIAPPQPEHIEFVVQYQQRLLNVGGKHGEPLRRAVSEWLRVARQLLHESVESDDGELHTTDGLMIATSDLLHRSFGRLEKLGFKVGARDREIAQAVHARCAKALRERALARGTRKP